MKRLSIVLALALLLGGCSTMGSLTGLPGPGPVTNVHQSWAAADSTCILLGEGITMLMTISPMGIIAAGIISKAACNVEAALVSGQPAQVVTTTTTETSQTVPAK